MREMLSNSIELPLVMNSFTRTTFPEEVTLRLALSSA